MDKSCAQEWKFKGNQAFKQNNYQKAIEYFTKALEFDPDDHVFYSNRSACYATVGEYNKALEDAVMCCEIRPDWVKGYTRKALAEFYLGNYPDAINTYKKALEIEPENSDLKAGLLKATEASIKKDKDPILSLFEGPALVRLMSHPRTKEFFQQSDFVSQLNAIQNDNKKSLEFMDDPRFMECLSVLLGQESAYSKPQVNESSSQNDRSSRRYDEDHQSQKTAEEEKTLGNAAFNKKMWNVALEHYDKAINLNPNEIVYLNNKAACYFALGDYETCIELCDKALEIGRKTNADYKKTGRALSRKGMALEKLDRLDDAVDCLKSSLLEQSDDKVRFQLRDLEKKRKRWHDNEYNHQGIAEERHNIANHLFNKRDYEGALSEFNEVIRRHPNDITYLSNRAVCLMKLREFYKALSDLEKIIEIDPDNITAHTQKGLIHAVMKEYSKALESYDKGLSLDPNNTQCKDGFRNVVKALNFEIDCTNEERIMRKLVDPQIRNILSDPQLIEYLETVELNPSQSADPGVQENYNKLIDAGIKKAGTSS